MRTQAAAVENPFDDSVQALETLIDRLRSPESGGLTHGEAEALIELEGREVLRRLYQGYLESRGTGDVGPVLVGADGIRRTRRFHSTRRLESLFGTVEITRLGYRMPEVAALFPLDAQLSLPPERYSIGVRRRVASAAARDSFDEAVTELSSTTGAHVPKRQAEELAARAAVDFDDFYAEREAAAQVAAEPTSDLLILSADGKGVVMRKEDLRPATRKASEVRKHKLDKRLCKGEKRNAKRMATVAAVYTIAPHVRDAAAIASDLDGEPQAEQPKRPKPEHKRVWASLAKTPEQVIDEAFSEARRRDPEYQKTWIALVDGNKPQLALLKAGAVKHSVGLTIILDVIHVIEYLWRAARALHEETSAEGERWVRERLLRLLEGKCSSVVAGMRRSATKRGLSEAARKPIDDCARYLMNNREYLQYDVALANGYPIATGVIEGACRHVVKDRMDLTGARWSLSGAEAILRLRSLRASRDFDAYWRFHTEREQAANHDINYQDQVVPSTLPPRLQAGKPLLRLVK